MTLTDSDEFSADDDLLVALAHETEQNIIGQTSSDDLHKTKCTKAQKAPRTTQTKPSKTDHGKTTQNSPSAQKTKNSVWSKSRLTDALNFFFVGYALRYTR